MSGVLFRVRDRLRSGTLRSHSDPAHPAALHQWIDIWKGPALQAGLNPFSQGLEKADALKLVVGQFDTKEIFGTRKHFHGLQAIKTQFLVKIIPRRKWSRCQVKKLFV